MHFLYLHILPWPQSPFRSHIEEDGSHQQLSGLQ